MIPPKKACDQACTCKECVYRLCISNSPFLQIMFTFLHCRLICFCRSGSKTARQIFAPNQILQTMTQKCHSVIFRDSIRNYLCDRESQYPKDDQFTPSAVIFYVISLYFLSFHVISRYSVLYLYFTSILFYVTFCSS